MRLQINLHIDPDVLVFNIIKCLANLVQCGIIKYFIFCVGYIHGKLNFDHMIQMQKIRMLLQCIRQNFILCWQMDLRISFEVGEKIDYLFHFLCHF